MSTMNYLWKAAAAGLTGLLVMTAFEATKSIVFTRVTVWQSHAMTILFCAALVFILSAVFLIGEQDKVKASISFSEGIVEGVPGIFYLINEHGELLRCNETLKNQSGYSAEELTRMRVLDFFKESDKSLVAERMQQVFSIGHSTVEASFVAKDRTQTPFLFSGKLLMVEGKPCMVGLGIDISKRKRAEEAEHKSAEEFKAAFEDAPFGMCLACLDNRLLRVNRAFCQLVGYSREELLAGGWQGITQSDDLERSRRAADEMRSGRAASAEFEKRYIHKQGNVIWVYMRVSVVRDHRGEPSYFITHVQDITDRKQAERLLVESESKHRALFENSADAYLLSDEKGFLDCNSAALEIFGYSTKADLLALHPADLSPPNQPDGMPSRAGAEQQIAAAFLNRKNRFEWFHRRKNGEIFPAEVCMSTWTLNDRPALLGIVRDITERKRIEGELRQGEEQFRNLTENISEVFWIMSPAADKILYISPAYEKVWKRTRDSLYKNPMSWVEAIHPDDLERAHALFARQVPISAQLVGLMGGKIWVESEAGKGSTFHFTVQVGQQESESLSEPLDMPQLAGVSVLVVDDNATNRHILEATVVRWKMVPTAVESAAAAMKALEQAHDSGSQLPLVLTDAHMPVVDGYGLVEAIRKNPSFSDVKIVILTSGGKRGDADRCQALGIAAYLSKPFDRLELREVLLQVLATGPAKLETRALVTRHTIREQRQSLSFLVAEDNPINQKLISRLLEKRGHTVALAQNGRQALEALEKRHFDIVLMDVQMPEMDGFETTKRIREKETVSGAHQPIIALTAYAMKGDEERCLVGGMDGYVAKPIKLEELFSVMEKVVPGMNRRSDATVSTVTN